MIRDSAFSVGVWILDGILGWNCKKQDDFGTQKLTLKSGGGSTNLGLTFPFRIGVCMHICTGRGGGMNPRLAYWSIRGCDISNTDAELCWHSGCGYQDRGFDLSEDWQRQFMLWSSFIVKMYCKM